MKKECCCELKKTEDQRVIWSFIRYFYPQFFQDKTPEDCLMYLYQSLKSLNKKMYFEIWKESLEGFTLEEITTALKTYALRDTRGFPPTPGQIIDILIDQKEEE